MTVRRSQIDADGNQLWVLISQIEHARISGELAQAWHEDAFPSPEAREELIAATFHHDDGWALWEIRPGVDPETGKPRSFTEMPLAESLSQWRASIEICQKLGPLAAWTVAGHFSYLLRHSDAWQHRTSSSRQPSVGPVTDSDHEKQAAAWLEEFDARRQDWLIAWQKQRPDLHTAAAATDASTLLQLWDRMSLWLCCSEPTESYEIETTTSEPLTMKPCGAGQVELSPWPLSIDVYRPNVVASAVPVAHYATTDALAEAEHSDVTLSWELRAKAAEPTD